MCVLPGKCSRDELQGYKHVEAISFLLWKDRSAQALRRLCVAPAQARKRDQARALHGLVAVRRVTQRLYYPDPG